jgi:aryl-alcohol dehydrogenase-like predicted oxidoreductase
MQGGSLKKNILGRTDFELTNIGLGTFPMGGADWEAGWGPQDDKESVATIRKALEFGVNWIDTAPAYGLGKAETLVAEAIGAMSTPPIIATKCGLVWDSGTKLMNVLKRKSVKKEAESSLKRLKIDVIDLYQIHWPIPDEDIEEAWTAIAELIDEGKVRFGGVCNCSVAQMERLSKIHPIASLQPPYSMIIRDIEGGELQYCRKNHIGVIPYSPLQRGLLTGKYNKDTIKELAPNDHRRNEPYFKEPEFSVNVKLLDGLKPLAYEESRTLAQMALAWVLRRPEVTAVIVGARHPSQLDDTVHAGDWKLGRGKIRAIQRLLKAREREVSRV